jgi:hypothetical protein
MSAIKIHASQLVNEEGKFPYRLMFAISGLPAHQHGYQSDVIANFRKLVIPWGNANCDDLFLVEGLSVRFREPGDVILAQLKFL